MKVFDQIETYVLAGGKSSRMGQDKGIMQLGGRPMIASVLTMIQSLPLPVKIIAHADHYQDLGVPVVKDIVPDKGPAGGLLTAFHHSGRPYVFLVSCDTPFVSREAALRLMDSLRGEQAVIPTVRQDVHPLFGLYHYSLAGSLRSNMAGEKLKMKELIFSADHRFVDMDDLAKADPFLFFNINEAADIEKSRERWEQIM